MVLPQLSVVSAFIRHLLLAKDAHALHSPFAYRLYTEVIASKKHYQVFEDLMELRLHLLHDNTPLQISDLGAGSKHMAPSARKVSDLARHATIPPKVGNLLLKLADFLRPKAMLELGTCLGISTLYLHAGCHTAEFRSVEGSPALLEVARKNLLQFQADVMLELGNLDEILPSVLQKFRHKPELIFVDANHRYEPSLNYFNQCLKHAAPNAVFVFDDIHWSGEMQQAWAALQNHASVQVSMDLFHVGLLFLDKRLTKARYRLRF